MILATLIVVVSGGIGMYVDWKGIELEPSIWFGWGAITGVVATGFALI